MNRDGYLLVRGRAQYHSQWCRLKDNVLTYYDSPKDLYFPVGTVELRQAVAVLRMHSRANGFKIVMLDGTKWYMQADTEQAANEWMHVLDACKFRALNRSDVFKVVLPVGKLNDVQLVNSALLGDSVIVKVAGGDFVEEYCFAYLSDCRHVYEKLLTLRGTTAYSDTAVVVHDMQHNYKGQLKEPYSRTAALTSALRATGSRMLSATDLLSSSTSRRSSRADESLEA